MQANKFWNTENKPLLNEYGYYHVWIMTGVLNHLMKACLCANVYDSPKILGTAYWFELKVTMFPSYVKKVGLWFCVEKEENPNTCIAPLKRTA